VLGIRQGADLTQAMLFVRCRADTHFVVAEESTGLLHNTHGQKIRQTVTLTNGTPRARPYNHAKGIQGLETGTPDFDFITEKVIFWSLGVRDKETVLGIARGQYFKPGEEPPIDKLTDQLVAKYGQPTEKVDQGRTWVIYWVYDASGQKAQKSDRGTKGFCWSGMYTGSTQVLEGCGLTVIATLSKSNNPLLAEQVSVGVIDHGKAIAAIKEFGQLAANMQAQQRSTEAARRATSGAPAKF